MKVVTYVPHGAIPDIRGFAPAIVAQNFASHLQFATPYIISAREVYKNTFSISGGIENHRIQESNAYRKLFRKATRIDPYPLHRRAAKISKKIAPDIFHAHQLEFHVKNFLKHFGKNIPVVVHSHVHTGMDYSEDRGTANKYICPSKYVMTRLVEVKQYPKDRMTVIYNGVDTSLFSPPVGDEKKHLRRILNIPDDIVVVTFAGRKQEVKGFHTFLNIAKNLCHRDDIYFIAVGPEPSEAIREASYKDRQVLRDKLFNQRNYIEYSAISHTRLANIFKITDISLLPSIQEPQGMVMLESMSSGCITISSNVGGIRESIKNKKTGLLVNNPNDINEVTHILETAIGMANTDSDLISAAREHVVSNFDWEVTTNRLEELYFRIAKDT